MNKLFIFWTFSFQLKIKPYHFAVFRLNLTAPDHEGMFASDMLITTQFEDIWIPIAVRTADGSLIAIPESLHFDKMYPVSKTKKQGRQDSKDSWCPNYWVIIFRLDFAVVIRKLFCQQCQDIGNPVIEQRYKLNAIVL